MVTERAEPSHILRVAVPMRLTDEPPEFDPVEEALRVCLAVTRAAYAKFICDGIVVSIEEAAG